MFPLLLCAATHGPRYQGQACRRCCKFNIVFIPHTKSSPVSVYYFRCVGIVPMPGKVVPGDESGAQISLADAMPSCSSADKLQAVRTFHAALIV